MALTRDDAAKVARLARLRLDETELAALTVQLSSLLDYMAVLDELDVSGVEPMVHADERYNVLRPDDPTPSLPRAAALANAPKTDGKFFLVPAILEG